MTTRILKASLVGISSYSQSKAHDEPRVNDKESADDYDRRTWRSKAHFDPQTREVYIPPMSLKFSIAEAARRLAIKIPGKRNATYTKNILSGLMIFDLVELGVKVDELAAETIYANSDGRRGSGSRVFRRFPMIPSGWKGQVEIYVIDPEIPEHVVERCLEEAGSLVGIGRFRPERGGFLGRFAVEKKSWSTMG